MPEKLKFTIYIGESPISYGIEVDEKNFKTELGRLRAFIMKHNDRVQQLVSKTSSKIKVKNLTICRLPNWFNKINLEVAEATALVLYFVGKPISTGEITDIMKKEFREIDLRNVSKHLTSRTSDLYGYTSSDDGSRYYLNNYGKQWIETELLEKVRSLIQKKKENKKPIHHRTNKL